MPVTTRLGLSAPAMVATASTIFSPVPVAGLWDGGWRGRLDRVEGLL